MNKRFKQIIEVLSFRFYRLSLFILLISATASCDSILDYDEGDCTIEYRVKFKYDYNMKFANAFAKEVERVTLYAFDEDGKFVYQKMEEGNRLKADDYSMKVEIDPGKYHLVAWAGLVDESYAIPLLVPGKSDLEELTVQTNRITQTRAANGQLINVVGNIASLWHGESLQTFTRAGRQEEITVSLVKNTNAFRVILQQMDGVPIDVNAFDFSITDDNGLMNYDNSLLKDDMLTYQPYNRSTGSITRSTSKTKVNSEMTTPISTAIADLKVGRLLENQKPRLTITNKETKETVLSIPLIDYLILTKSIEHKEMPAQEYLDREDRYTMTFFLDPNMAWLKTEIMINDWIIRINENDL